MTRPLRVGVQLPEVERVVRFEELLSIALAAERSGFDSAWVGDHLLYRGDGREERGPLDCWSVLAGLAAATERLRLGPLVACTAFRPPGLLARAAQAVDEMSGGRLTLGLGAGWNRAEFEAFGLRFDHRVARFEESFDAIRRLLSGERVSVEGRFVRLEDAVLHPSPLRRPRLMVGSNGPRMLAATLPFVDCWNTWWDDYGNTAEGFARLNATIDEATGRAGKDPAEIERSACALVRLGSGVPERPVPPGVEPLDGRPRALADALLRLKDAGADEVILVVTPILERSVLELGEALELLDTA